MNFTTPLTTTTTTPTPQGPTDQIGTEAEPITERMKIIGLVGADADNVTVLLTAADRIQLKPVAASMSFIIGNRQLCIATEGAIQTEWVRTETGFTLKDVTAAPEGQPGNATLMVISPAGHASPNIDATLFDHANARLVTITTTPAEIAELLARVASRSDAPLFRVIHDGTEASMISSAPRTGSETNGQE